MILTYDWSLRDVKKQLEAVEVFYFSSSASLIFFFTNTKSRNAFSVFTILNTYMDKERNRNQSIEDLKKKMHGDLVSLTRV